MGEFNLKITQEADKTSVEAKGHGVNRHTVVYNLLSVIFDIVLREKAEEVSKAHKEEPTNDS